MNLCKPNTCLNWANCSVPKRFRQVLLYNTKGYSCYWQLIDWLIDCLACSSRQHTHNNTYKRMWPMDGFLDRLIEKRIWWIVWEISPCNRPPTATSNKLSPIRSCYKWYLTFKKDEIIRVTEMKWRCDICCFCFFLFFLFYFVS